MPINMLMALKTVDKYPVGFILGYDPDHIHVVMKVLHLELVMPIVLKTTIPIPRAIQGPTVWEKIQR